MVHRASSLFLILLLASLVSSSSKTWAQNAISSSSISPAELRKPLQVDSFAAAFKMENFNYNEPGMNTQGLLYGVDGRYEHIFLSRSLVQSVVLDFELLAGRTEYTGSTWAGAPVTASNLFNVYQFEGQYHLPRFWNLGSAYLTPLSGLGLRGTSQDKESAGDYRREYYYFYGSIGLEMQLLLRGGSHFRLRGQGDYLFSGYNNTYLSDASSRMPDVTLTFTSGSAYRLEAEYDFRLQDAHELQVTMSYAVWSMQASNPQDIGGGNLVYEPVNQTFLTGLNVGYLF